MFIVRVSTARTGQTHERKTAEAAVEEAQRALSRGCAHVQIISPDGRCFRPSEFLKLLHLQAKPH